MDKTAISLRGRYEQCKLNFSCLPCSKSKVWAEFYQKLSFMSKKIPLPDFITGNWLKILTLRFIVRLLPSGCSLPSQTDCASCRCNPNIWENNNSWTFNSTHWPLNSKILHTISARKYFFNLSQILSVHTFHNVLFLLTSLFINIDMVVVMRGFLWRSEFQKTHLTTKRK